jgi:peptide/nickel transport system substrate-binding protein
VKNPNYFQAERVRITAVEYIHVPVPAQVTAMRAGTVDAIDLIGIQNATQLSGSGLTVEIERSDSVHVWSQMCKTDAPFNDVRVQQALDYAGDREVVNDLVFDGNTEPLSGVVPLRASATRHVPGRDLRA